MNVPQMPKFGDITEERLQADLVEARLVLDAASAKHRELMRLHMISGVTSDGVVTLQEVQHLHRSAIRRYAIVLARFSELWVGGSLRQHRQATPL